MRSFVKKQLQELIKKLIETVDVLDKTLSRLNYDDAVALLTGLQELAIEIGNVIESSEGAENKSIHELENVCEMIYQISLSLGDAGAIKRISKALRKQLIHIDIDIRNNISTRKEILFLPYQVSMWDSLESIWTAAIKENKADIYVVPIPYYDVKPDGTLGELHYEGEKYPDYVPVMSYKEYSIEERKPDVIFFHNPYDGCNSVTRVPEQYYSTNLKQNTDMLVYIPYHVSEKGGPADHQCYMPGVLMADRVVVQPGEVYEKYCRIYTKTLKEQGWESVLATAREKFLPLGSPKFDKIKNTKYEIEDLPKDWQKTIQKPDGSNKKIVLYNLTITALLENGEQVLKKVDSVFDIFRERQEDLVLLWRPHPLLMKTIHAMRPQLRDMYMARVEKFKEEDWGIFDDTPDPNLAMALSDAYYGDMSSLVTTYRETGKPIMLQNMRI